MLSKEGIIIMETVQKTNEMELNISVIIPTLNEEAFLECLLKSLKRQTCQKFEIIIVDGGSNDKTVQIAKKYNAKIITRPKTPEFESRNIGGKIANGEILLFTSADIVFRIDTIQKMAQEFKKDNSLGAICGPGNLYNAPLWTKIEYITYYTLLGMWIRITKDFHGSTNFMAVRKKNFEQIGGFKNRIDADGNFLNNMGKKKKVKFISTSILVSGRRARKMGFIGFNIHFLYILDIFFPFLRETKLINFLKNTSLSYRLKTAAKKPRREKRNA